jgi:hypothetical protein
VGAHPEGREGEAEREEKTEADGAEECEAEREYNIEADGADDGEADIHGSQDSAVQHTCIAEHMQCNTAHMQYRSTHAVQCSAAQCNAPHMQCNTHTV